MIGLAWNCQGLGKPLTVKALGEMTHSHKVDFVFLSETHNEDDFVFNTMEQLKFEKGVTVPPIDRAGGLCLWWRQEFTVDIIDSSRNFIDTRVYDPSSGRRFRVTWMYGPPYQEDKTSFWEDWYARDLGDPWIVLGDLNETLSPTEKEGGAPWNAASHPYLENFMNSNGMMDLGYVGQPFTWVRKENGEVVLQERLDRAFINEDWLLNWPNSHLLHLPRIGSDHHPILLKTTSELRKARPTFKFESHWADEAEVEPIVRSSWLHETRRRPLDNWDSNLKRCRDTLKDWSRRKFPKDIKEEVKACLLELDDLQSCLPLQSGPRQKELEQKLGDLWLKEEKYWHQRSRVKWLQFGDSNSRFFHLSTLQRRRRNRILRIQDNYGRWILGEENIRREFENHFMATFSSSGVRDCGQALDGVSRKVTVDMNQSLLSQVTLEEVKQATHQLGALKAPGPDGFPGLFYQKYWNFVHGVILDSSKDFLGGRICLKKLNRTNIVLIPKVDCPEKTSQFRPISLCNNSYKILSKILANRLKEILPSLISPNQNAFVAERLIQDNLILAHESYHYLKLKREGGNNELALKLDMVKAYDRVEWDFLEEALIRFGFSIAWVRIIMACVTSVSFSIVLNGKQGKAFTPSRGLRQGDPLSPYLFLIVSEVLSLRITKAVKEKQIMGIRLCRGCPTLSHLFFADDALFFLKATLANLWQFSHILKEYCVASGQDVSKEKSSIFFSPNTPDQMALLCCELLDFKEVMDPGIYLGLPTIWGRSKKGALNYIADRVKRKLEGWKEKTLSWAGKETLIKAVALSIPSYPMSCFKLPKGFCERLNSDICNFWWGYNGEGNKIHWKAWSHLSKPKGDGGLGFKDLHHFNMALLGKQCWRLLQDPDSLWARVLKARYFPNCSFMEATKGHKPSWCWSSLVEAKDLLLKDCKWLVGNGENIDIWGDQWVPPPHVGTIQKPNPSYPSAKVSSIINWDLMVWDLDSISSVVPHSVVQAISSIPLSDRNAQDKLIWPFSKEGSYSVKLGYQSIHFDFLARLDHSPGTSHRVDRRIWKLIWGIKAAPRVKHFIWQVLSNAGPSLSNLHKRKISTSPLCPICNMEEESFTHIITLCPWVEPVWFGSMLGIRVNKQEITTIDQWVATMYSKLPISQNKERFLTFWAYTCWFIWKARCEFVYKGSTLNPHWITSRASAAACEYLEANMTPIPLTRAHHDPSDTDWTRPQVGFHKINCDAAWSDPGGGSIGIVVRDHMGSLIAGSSKRISAGSAEEAELCALRDGVDLACNLNLKKVIMESDSKHAIDDMKKNTCRSWITYPILIQIRSRLNAFEHCDWSWVPRRANMAAHAAAKLSYLGEGPLNWTSQPPLSLVSVLRSDGLTGPPLPSFIS